MAWWREARFENLPIKREGNSYVISIPEQTPDAISTTLKVEIRK